MASQGLHKECYPWTINRELENKVCLVYVAQKQWTKMQQPRHCIPAGGLECFEIFHAISFFLVLLLTNQGKHTVEKVNKRELSKSLCPSLAILNKSRSEMSSQTLHFPLGWILVLAHWGCIFGSAQFICWFPNLACDVHSEAQWELLVGSFLSTPFSDDTSSHPFFTGWCCQLCSLFQSWTMHPNSSSPDWGFFFCCSHWQCAVPLRALLSPPWKWCFTQRPDDSGVPEHAGPLCPKKEKLLCMWTEEGEMALQLCLPFLENSSNCVKWIW